jgi:site-specific recombinase XerD
MKMEISAIKQRIINPLCLDTYLITWIEAFLFDRKAQNLTKGTLLFYRGYLELFTKFCDTQLITKIDQIEPGTIRQYMVWLGNTDHNAGGINAAFRSLRAFLLWWENETEPEGWKNPIRKVRAPKVGIEPLEPVALETVKALIDTCERDNFLGIRDKAMFLCLLDTGARASEFVNIDLEDINPFSGEILIRKGKGRKPRTVFIGQKSRKALRKYLRLRTNDCGALWVTEDQRVWLLGDLGQQG